MYRRFRRGATAIEYGIVAALLGITTLSLASVGFNMGDMYTTAPCVSEGKDPKKCGIPRTGQPVGMVRLQIHRPWCL